MLNYEALANTKSQLFSGTDTFIHGVCRWFLRAGHTCKHSSQTSALLRPLSHE